MIEAMWPEGSSPMEDNLVDSCFPVKCRETYWGGEEIIPPSSLNVYNVKETDTRIFMAQMGSSVTHLLSHVAKVLADGTMSCDHNRNIVAPTGSVAISD